MDNFQLDNQKYKPATVGEWIKRYLLLCIPIVNIVMLILWSTDSKDIGKQLWARATAIFAGIIFVFYFLIISFYACIFSTTFFMHKQHNYNDEYEYYEYRDYYDDITNKV